VLENLVTAVSVLPDATTSPESSKELDALFQIRFPLATELRTTLVIFKAFETLIKTPSVTPATFFPARVSELDPATVKVPSLCRTIASDVVEDAPICNSLEKTPAVSAFARKPALPFSVPIIPTIDAPVLSTAIDVGNKT